MKALKILQKEKCLLVKEVRCNRSLNFIRNETRSKVDFLQEIGTARRLIVILLVVMTQFWCACDGDNGAVGPAGPKGDKGDQGPQGPQGVSGNANVTLYEYGAQTFSGSFNYLIPDISQAKIDSSMVIAYYNPAGAAATAWYGIPSLGPGNAYIATNHLYQSSVSPSAYTMEIKLFTPGGSEYTESTTFIKFRIFVTKASSIVEGGRVKTLNAAEAGIDLADHDALCEYFGLPKD